MLTFEAGSLRQTTAVDESKGNNSQKNFHCRLKSFSVSKCEQKLKFSAGVTHRGHIGSCSERPLPPPLLGTEFSKKTFIFHIFNY